MKEIEEISTDLQSKLTGLEKETNTIKRLALSIVAAREAIERVEGLYVDNNEFIDEPAALVNFNRNLAPPFYAKYIFFSKLRAFECLILDEEPGEREKIRDHELAGIARFFERYKPFRVYYLSGGSGHDMLYFRDFEPSTIQLNDMVVGISDWVNRGCLLVAYMQAFDAYKAYLTKPTEMKEAGSGFEPAHWKGTLTELVEQILGEHATKHTFVNGRPATLEYLITRAEKMYSNVSLKSFDSLAAQLRARQSGPTLYHEKKIKLLKDRTDDLLGD